MRHRLAMVLVPSAVPHGSCGVQLERARSRGTATAARGGKVVNAVGVPMSSHAVRASTKSH